MLCLQRSILDPPVFIRACDENGLEIEIKVHLVRVKDHSVVLGFDAPKNIEIVRGELLDELDNDRGE